jgi:hypothetical protein
MIFIVVICFFASIYAFLNDIAFFQNKCTSKELKPEDFHAKLEQKLPQYKARWKNSMKDQIKDLPDFEKVEREVSRKIKNWMK